MSDMQKEDDPGPTHFELVQAYDALGDAELNVHADAIRAVLGKRVSQQLLGALPPRHPVHDSSFLGKSHVGTTCDCGSAHNGGMHSDWCSTRG